MLPRELYTPLGGHNQCLCVGVSYVDGDLTREEVWSVLDDDDAGKDPLLRRSPDNGRTWTFPAAVSAQRNRQLPGGGWLEMRQHCFDPGLGREIALIMRRQWPGLPLYTMDWETNEHPFVDHSFVDYGDREVLLRYEGGADYDPEKPFDPAHLDSNRGYSGTPLFLPDGRAWFPIVCYRPGAGYSFNRGGLVLMRRESATGPWLPSNQIWIDPEVSSRGLLEPAVTLLRNGNLLIVCRGSNLGLDPLRAPGRKWMTVSTDGGRTLSEIDEFRWDDGTSFYSPSSIHTFLRSTRNGRLYWLANITPDPPSGNLPRHPLDIFEIDEAQAAVKRAGAVRVDQRRPGEPDTVQISNFSVLENRETQEVEIYLTRLGEDPETTWRAMPYRYLFSPPA